MLSFHIKFVQTDRRTTVKQYTPDLWTRGHKKEKLLIWSNFSFSDSVFKRHVLLTHKNKGLFGKGLMDREAIQLSP